MPPFSVTDSYDAELTASSRYYLPRLRDNIVKGMKYMALLDSKGRIRYVDGGHSVMVPLMYGLNETASVMSGYDIVSTAPQDGITMAEFTWAQCAVSITINKKERRQNAHDKKFDLLEAKMKQAEKSIRYLMSRAIVQGTIASSSASGSFTPIAGKLNTAALGPLPLGAIIDTDNDRTRTDVGSINPLTYSWWRNVANSSTASTFAGFKIELYKLYNDCSKGDDQSSPDIALGGQVAFETYHNALQTQERYVDMKTVNLLNGAENLKIKGAVFIWDELVPDTETNAILDSDGKGTAIGTLTVDTVFMINSDTVELIVDKESNYAQSDFVRPENQVGVSTSIIDWMGAHTVNNKRKNGVLYGIAKNIVA